MPIGPVARAALQSKLEDLKKTLSNYQSCSIRKQVPPTMTKAERNRSDVTVNCHSISEALAEGKVPDPTQIVLAIRAAKRLGAIADRLTPEIAELSKINWETKGPEIAEKLDDAVAALESASKARSVDAQRVASVLGSLVETRETTNQLGSHIFKVRERLLLNHEETAELEAFFKSLGGLNSKQIASRVRAGVLDETELRAAFYTLIRELPPHLRDQDQFAVAAFKLAGVFKELRARDPREELGRLEKRSAGSGLEASRPSVRCNPQVAADLQDMAALTNGRIDMGKVERDYQRVAEELQKWQSAGKPQTHRRYDELTSQLFKLGRLRRLAKQAEIK
jgi:hypothetical protein